jgi:hypothetical protein
MTDKKPTRELNPLEQSIKEFLKDQDDYGRYLEKLREKEKLPEPKDFKKGGEVKPKYWGEMRDISYKKSTGSLIDKPLEQSESLSQRKALARHMLYKRKSFENGGTTSDRIKELENIKKLLFPLIKDFESADLYEKASEELKLLKKQQ